MKDFDIKQEKHADVFTGKPDLYQQYKDATPDLEFAENVSPKEVYISISNGEKSIIVPRRYPDEIERAITLLRNK